MRRKEERLYSIWGSMRNRCKNKNNANYLRYGGRGITICKEWNDYLTFKKWALENGYNDTLSIDRIDNNGNYEPSNCRWADRIMQANNKRNNHLITFNGETHTAAEWSKLTGIHYRTILSRLNRDKLPPEKVLVKKKLCRDKNTGKFLSIKEL